MTNKERKALRDKERMNMFLLCLSLVLLGGFLILQAFSFLSLFSSNPLSETVLMTVGSWMCLIGGIWGVWEASKGNE